MFASLNKVGSLESTEFRRLDDLEKDVRYRILEAEKFPTRFGEKVRPELEGFVRVLLPERFNRVMTREELGCWGESGLIYKGSRNLRKLHLAYLLEFVQ